MNFIRLLFFVFLWIFPLKLTSDEAPSNRQLVICTIFQDEAPYIKEWIEFHRLVGVQYFYLYNNLSTDNFEEIVKPYIDEGIVEIIDWPYAMKKGDTAWRPIQRKAFNDCIKRAKKDNVEWIAFIDIDEFLFALEKDQLLDALQDYEEPGIGGVAVNWQLYGTSFIAKLPTDKLLIEALLYKADPDYVNNRQLKIIARAKYLSRCSTAHIMHYQKGYSTVTENKVRCRTPMTRKVSVNKFRINHYWSRDEEFFYNVKIPRRQEKVHQGEKISEIEKRNDKCNAMLEDNPPIFRFIPELRKRMQLDK